MPLIYAFVARGHTVLAEYTSYSGNFATIAAQVCESGALSRGTCAKAHWGSRSPHR